MADTTVDRLVVAEDAVWHATANGLGFERTSSNEAWIWQVEDGDRLTDAAWTENRSTVGFLSGQSMVVADTDLTDESDRFSIDLDGAPVAVARGEGVWYTLVDQGGALGVLTFDNELKMTASHNLSIALPGTVLAYDLMMADDALLIRVEGLLSSTYYRGDLPLSGVEEVDPEAWPTQPDAPVASAEACDGRVAAVLPTGETWCSFEHGLLRLNASTLQVDAVRLPVLSDAPGFGKLPQMVLAFGGEGATLEVEQGHVLTSARLDALALNLSDELEMTGVLPYAYGNDSSLSLQYNGAYTAIEGFDQLSDLDAVVLGLVSLADAEELALAGTDDRSLLMFSGQGFSESNATSLEAIVSWFDERSRGGRRSPQHRGCEIGCRRTSRGIIGRPFCHVPCLWYLHHRCRCVVVPDHHHAPGGCSARGGGHRASAWVSAVATREPCSCTRERPWPSRPVASVR